MGKTQYLISVKDKIEIERLMDDMMLAICKLINGKKIILFDELPPPKVQEFKFMEDHFLEERDQEKLMQLF